MIRTIGPLALAVLLGLAACGPVEPFAPHKTTELAEGPGLFTGKDGAFYILRGEDAPARKTETSR